MLDASTDVLPRSDGGALFSGGLAHGLTPSQTARARWASGPLDPQLLHIRSRCLNTRFRPTGSGARHRTSTASDLRVGIERVDRRRTGGSRCGTGVTGSGPRRRSQERAGVLAADVAGMQLLPLSVPTTDAVWAVVQVERLHTHRTTDDRSAW